MPPQPSDRLRADRLLVSLLELPASERLPRLEKACGGDEILRRRVGRLLEAAEAPGGVVDPDTRWSGELWRGLAADLAAERSAAPGERIGSWCLLEELGSGGMGTVYLAERVGEEFEQRGALKLIRPGADVGEILRRFEQERQILASLSHPGIACLIDGGTDGSGRPYLVMEYVQGLALDTYCHVFGADLERRLGLFTLVAEAVEYAHRHLVVHRDLKPSNILVTDDGQVKLLDFGIAKLLAPGPGGRFTPPTRTMFRALTPEYASPEQVRGERITTASDVYQLGILLYELLSGRRPFSFGDAGPLEIERLICHQDPLPPSTAAAQPPRVPLGPHDATSLRRRLRGDLDTIVLKALAKEPERRYASVSELRDDLRRFREGVPIRARRPTTLYRVGKFVRRHRVVVAAGVTILGLLAGYAATVTVHAHHLAAEAAKTERVKDMLASLFTAANPGVSQGTEPTASDLLEAGARRVATELQDQPEIQAEMMTLLGEVYGTLGRYEAAAELLEPALAMRQRLLGASHPEVARTAHQLGQARHYQGRLEEAEALLREALVIRHRAFGETSPQVALTLDELGDLLHTRGDFVEAEAVLRRALSIQLAVGSDPETIERHLANVLRDRGAVDEPETLYRRSLATSEKRFGLLDPIAALTRSELAVLLAESDRHGEAESLLRQNLSVYATIYPRGHPMEGTTLRNLGLLRLREGRAPEARELLESSLASYGRTLTEESSLIPRSQRYLAEAMLALGDTEAAAELARTAAARLRELGLPGHPAVADSLETLGLARLAQDRPAEAEAALREALEIRLRVSAPSDPRLEWTGEHLAIAAARERPRGD